LLLVGSVRRPARSAPVATSWASARAAGDAWPAGVAAGAGHPAGRAAGPAPAAAGGVVVLGSRTHRAGHGTSCHGPRVPWLLAWMGKAQPPGPGSRVDNPRARPGWLLEGGRLTGEQLLEPGRRRSWPVHPPFLRARRH